ncbi:hypothetical protein [Chelativorans sp. YIM 93263]|uniref:hypothetical protein n=1 Tax=Chelativorans sp. YIM 93263 TaxID=2906648 RepID=UPI002378E827|nr:hypothetical protein [Chelativorans sp. YIM 93263]
MLRTAFGALAVVALLTTPIQAQDGEDQGESIGTQQHIDRDDSPVIIRERPPADAGTDGAEVRSEEEAFVQIPGAWATDEAACADAEGSETGLYLTDTIIRWEGATCNIRNIDSENGSGTIYSQCAGENGRRDRRFRLEVTDDDTLSLRPISPTGQDEFTLERCPSGQ